MATDTVQNSVYVGPVLRGDGNGGSGLRASRNGGLVVTPEAPALYEPASRGVIFSCSTALAGTTVVAANNSGVAAAAATILSLYNPLGSGVNLALIKTGVWFTSGTPAAGMWCYNVAYNQTITATANAVMGRNLPSGAASSARRRSAAVSSWVVADGRGSSALTSARSTDRGAGTTRALTMATSRSAARSWRTSDGLHIQW